MTRDEFTTAAAPLLRHGLTVLAGVLAAKGFASGSTILADYGPSIVLSVVAVGWSILEKNKLVAGAVEALPADDIGLLAEALHRFRKEGASPLLVAHTAQTLAQVAVAEASVFAVNVLPQAATVPLPDTPSPVGESIPAGPSSPFAAAPLVTVSAEDMS